MAAPAEAQAGGPKAGEGVFEPPRGMTLLNMRTAAGPRLGVKLAKGILDVAAAAASYKLPAPIDTDDLLQNGKGGMLAKLVAAAADGPARLYLQESAVQHAPLVTRPEKIIMMGFNYRRHAAETGTPIPKNPDSLQQVQHRAQSPRRHDRAADGDGDAVRLRSRAGDRLRPRVPQRVGSRRARLRGRLLHRQRLLRPRHAVPHLPVHDREDVRRVRAARVRTW